MEKGLYSAVSGSLAAERAMDVTANNIANTNTTGYKAKKAVFAEVLGSVMDRSGSQVEHAATVIDPSQGALEETGRSLDLAVEGRGYLAIASGSGLKLSRSERAEVSSDGLLVTGDGHPILDRDGQVISLPNDGEKVEIGRDGGITVDGVVVGEVGVVDAPVDSLSYTGTRLVAPSDVMTSGSGAVVSGTLERSNSNPVEGMVEVVRASRTFEMLSHMIESFAEIDRKTSEIGKR